MNHLSQRMKTLFAAILTVSLIALSVTGCSPRNTEEAPQDSKGETQQSTPKDSEPKEGKEVDTAGTDEKKQDEAGSPPQADMEKPVDAPESSPEEESRKSTEGEGKGPDSTVSELSQEEAKGYMIKYIQPYYITGLMYTTWTSAEEIGTEKLIKFYEYNALGDYCVQLEQENPEEYHNASQWSVPAEIVEFFITYYFKVDSQYLHQAENYDAETNTYTFPKEFGIGGGPGVVLEKIDKNESDDIWTFICSDSNGQELSFTVEVVDQDQFYYVSGKGN